MEIIPFLAKPILYVLAFVVGAKVFASSGPHRAAKTWVVVLLAAIARLALGFGGGFAAMTAADTWGVSAFYAVLLVSGFIFWLLIVKLAFQRAPWLGLILFALVAEAVSGGIDIFAWHAFDNFRFC